MSSTINKTMVIPVRGMTCNGCSTKVEQAIRKLQGVTQVTADLGSSQVSIEYDPKQVDLVEFQYALGQAGYTIPTGEVQLKVLGMSCMSCVAHVEGALAAIPGVLEASVSLSEGTARVTFVPDLVTLPQMELAVQEAGYQAAGSVDKQIKAPEQTDRPYDASRIGQLKRLFQRN